MRVVQNCYPKVQLALLHKASTNINRVLTLRLMREQRHLRMNDWQVKSSLSLEKPFFINLLLSS
jgi:hypothetical protein